MRKQKPYKPQTPFQRKISRLKYRFREWFYGIVDAGLYKDLELELYRIAKKSGKSCERVWPKICCQFNSSDVPDDIENEKAIKIIKSSSQRWRRHFMSIHMMRFIEGLIGEETVNRYHNVVMIKSMTAEQHAYWWANDKNGNYVSRETLNELFPITSHVYDLSQMD